MNFLVYLHSIGINHKKLNKIFENNNDYKGFFENLFQSTLKKYYNEKQLEKILENKSKLNTKKIDEKLKTLQVKIITKHHKDFPKLLLNIANTPYFLYVRGKLNGDDKFFSIVGSRKITEYSKKVGKSIIPDLTKYFSIVSGGAGGCDSLAHKITLENNGKTIVVFGTGIDLIYPVYNKNIFEEVIKKGGALISIFPIGTHGSLYSFPVRNEIVAGMSKGVLILQASEKSGTLITSNLALDGGKDLFAIPGDIFNKNYIGTNNLIKDLSAKLTTTSEDILNEYNYKNIDNKKEIVFENEIQKNIYNLLKYNLPLSIDEIIDKTQYNYGVLSLNLTMMELSMIIKKNNFGKYSI